jgi:hypothetical protein
MRMSREEEELKWLIIMSYIQGLTMTVSTRGKPIGTPISEFNDTLMGTPNNKPQESFSPYSLLFHRCSKIFPGLCKPEVLFTNEAKQVRNRFQPNFQLDQELTRQFLKSWTKLFCHALLLCHKWHTRRRF